MSRQKRHRRAKKAGIPTNDNYKSKTSPSAIKRNTARWNAYFTLGRVYRRKHTKRAETKARLTVELGLPPDTVFIFRWSKKSDYCLFDRDPIMIYFGTVAVINTEDLSLLMVVRCTRFKDMDPLIRSKFDHSISISFKVARARWKCETNGAVQKPKEEGKFWGWMGVVGWRGGSDPGISLGPYHLSDFTCRYLDRILADEIRMATFHWIRDFLAERFGSLSFTIFQTNLQVGLATNAPGFDDEEWQHTPNGKVFASNMVVSCDGFYNEPHTDNDHTRYAFGINCLIDRETGKPYQLEGSENKGSICGSSFILSDFDIVVDHDRCDGIYETLWDTQVEHYTAESITYDEHGHEISPTKCAITRFGTSCQISKSLVEHINIVEKERDKMKPTEWEAYHKSRVRTLEEETEFKEIKAVASEAIMVERESMRKEARKVKAEMKRKAKLNTLFKGGKV